MNRVFRSMGLFCLFYVGQMVGAFGATVLPSDLVGKCAVVSAVFWMDDYESGSMTVVDGGGRRLLFNYWGDDGIIEYGDRKKGGVVKSVAGGKQEQVLLQILRALMLHQSTPVPVEGNSAYSRHQAAVHFMRVVDYRCQHKTGKIPLEFVENDW